MRAETEVPFVCSYLQSLKALCHMKNKAYDEADKLFKDARDGVGSYLY